MKSGLLFAPLAVLTLVIPLPASAQMDWLTPHLDAQRHANTMKRRQLQQQRAPQQKQRETHRTSPGPEITMAERQAAWSRNKAEYRRRLLAGGQASADRWLDSLVVASR